MWGFRRSALVSLVGIALLLLLILLSLAVELREERGGILTVSFLNVGQGDAIFVDAPSGRQALVDGGRDRLVLRELSRVMPWYDRSIDVVIATHPDLDHIGGLVDVLARYDVARIFTSSVKDEKGSDSRAFETAASKENAERIIAERGQVIDLGEGARIEILFPDRNVPAIETNTGCVVARVVYGKTAFMLSCDSPKAVEAYLVGLDGKDLHSNVLKAGHHGSKTSSSEMFVGFVAPEYAVFSRGCENSYGHPHAEVVALFERFQIPTYDTCKDGTISFRSDGSKVSIK